MWDVFSFPDPHNKEKKWDLLLYQYQFYLDYAKFYIKNFRRFLRHINMCFRTWRVQECTWGTLFQMPFFRRYWDWCHRQILELRSILPQWLPFSLIPMMLWRRLLIICRDLNSRFICGIMSHIDMIQYCLMLRTLIVPGPLRIRTLATYLIS